MILITPTMDNKDLENQEVDSTLNPQSVDYGNATEKSADFDDELGKQEEMENFIENAPIEEIEEYSEPIQNDIQEQFNGNLFNGNEFFKKNPQKVLGSAYQTSGRFGEVTKYKGTIDALDNIDVPLNFIGNQKSLEPLNSSVTLFNASGELTNPANDALASKAIYQSEVDKKRKRAKKPIESIDEQDPKSLEIVSFEEMYHAVDKNGRGINADISYDELEAYIWYQTETGNPLSRNWINLIQPNTYKDNLRATEPYNVKTDKIVNWIKEGVCYYYRGEILPAYLYFSGDMYDKKLALDNTDKEKIIELYGEDVYNQQVINFGLAFSKKMATKLTINDTESSLVVLAISKLAKRFMIKTIELLGGEEGYEANKNKYGGIWGYLPYSIQEKTGKISIAWEKVFQGKYTRKEKKFDELSLAQAFIYWLYHGRPLIKISSISAWEIAKYYVLGKPAEGGKDPAQKVLAQKANANAQQEGERLFQVFLNEQLTANDKIRLETEFNAKFNNYLPLDLNKVPVAFTMCKNYKGQREFLDPIKREAIAFMMHTGKGVLSYDVGVGKTPSSIFTISSFLDAGYCKRPVITVPNQVYRQFITELKTFAPHLKINEAYNLSDDIALNFMIGGFIQAVEEYSVTIMTYEGLEKIGFGEDIEIKIFSGLHDILTQKEKLQAPESAKKQTAFQNRLETIMGRVEKGSIYFIEDFGWDFAIYDEAHKMKKSFTQVKGDATGNATEKGGTEREKNPYNISAGTPSSIALKGFALNYYIQQENKGRNVMLLTATPFTNSPLEIYSMLAMVAYADLEKMELNSLKTFFDTFVLQKMDYVISAQYGVQLKKIIVGFNNLIALQTLIRRFILYKTGEEANVKRPKKYVLPYTKKVDGEKVITLSDEEKVETYLEMTNSQFELMEMIKSYVAGALTEDELFMGDYFESAASTTDSDDGDDEQRDEEESGIMIDEDALELSEDDIESENERTAVRILKGLSYGRDLAISPYLLQVNIAMKLIKKGKFPRDTKMPVISPSLFVESSPKLLYAMKCIESVRDYHLAEGTPISGQVLYMDRGVKYFPLLRKYLIDVVGFKESEVQIIKSGLPKSGKNSKEYIKNLFNGEIYNEKTKLFEPVSDEERVKVIIGSSTIKEGINLQKYGTCLYNMNIDWNPTDVQQLEGRVYRQGNTFNSVRIVHPLLVNSADIFIFQKLQEKTSRINSIWSMDGRSNVLDTTDFDPSELKYTLISDVNVLLTLEIGSIQKNLEDNVAVYNQLIAGIQTLESKVHFLSPYRYQAIKRELNSWLRGANLPLYEDDKQLSSFENWKALIKKVISTMKVKNDGDGNLITSVYWDRGNVYEVDKEGNPLKRYSRVEPFEIRTNAFSEATIPSRDIQKAYETYFAPNGIAFDIIPYDDPQYVDQRYSWDLPKNPFISELKVKYENELAKFNDELEKLKSEEYQNSLRRDIIERIEEMRVATKNINAVVSDFAKLNYLLSDKKVTIEPSQVATIPPTPIEVEPIVKSQKEVLEENISLMKDLLEFVTEQSERKVIIENIKQIKEILQFV